MRAKFIALLLGCLLVLIATPSMAQEVNVALGKPATASSAFKDYTADMVVDGLWDDRDSRWLSGWNAKSPHWLEIDLQGTFVLTRAEVWTGNVGTVTRLYPVAQFKLQYWTGDGWEDIAGGGVAGNTDALVTLEFSDPVTTNKVRFYSDDDPDPTPDGFTGVRVREILLYGTAQ